jgi:hypothetical protein
MTSSSGIYTGIPLARACIREMTSAKDHLLLLARSRLPQHMGSRYAEIVETCLTCLNPDNADFGDARGFEDEDGIRVGVWYIEKVSFLTYVVHSAILKVD